MCSSVRSARNFNLGMEMASSATIHSTTPQGGKVELTVEKTGADTGNLTAKTWTSPNPGPTDRPQKSDTAPLYAVRLSSNPTKVTCKAKVFGPDPVVTCVLNADGANSKSVTLTIKGSLGGAADGTTTYPLADADFQAISNFLAGSGFPAG
jgi:hypothetical protein